LQLAGEPSPDADFEIPEQLKQRFCVVPMKLRLVVLAAVIKSRVLEVPDHAKLVVFFSTCDGVDFHHTVLGDAWTRATGAAILPKHTPLLKLHGDMPQAERTATLLAFTKATSGVLLCTDVAARGLDFPAVTSIVQFDPAGTSEEYVHRVGRTARLGHSGEALLFLLPAETGYVEYLHGRGVMLSEERVYGALDKAFPLNSVKYSPKNSKEALYRRSKHGANAGGDAGLGMLERHQGAFHAQQAILNAVAHDTALRCVAEDGFRAYVRAYATHGLDIKAFFSVRSLHLGHVAHSFGLRERPTTVGQSTSKSKALVRKRAQQSGGSGHKGRKIPTVAKPPNRFGGYVLS
jgi:ATP-dependent RNA helicase DDX31/DBP7